MSFNSTHLFFKLLFLLLTSLLGAETFERDTSKYFDAEQQGSTYEL